MFTVLLLTIALNQSLSVPTLTGAEARRHVGRDATVCGVVANARYVESSANTPTFLNLDRPNPNQTFTVVIFGDHREKFGRPEVRYKDKLICVTGRIVEFRGNPQIVATEPSQITEGAAPPIRIHSSEVSNHLGADASVCGFVAGVRRDTIMERKAILLNFDKPFPNETFSAVIFEEDRQRFFSPEVRYVRRNVCVTGKLEKADTSIRLVLSDPRQISFLQSW